MSPTAIILAAGKSTRMKSQLPKALHEVGGKPMLHFVLQACYGAGCERVIVIVGHRKDEVIARFEHDSRIEWVEQVDQLGTGHAAKMAEPFLKEHKGDAFILTADGPLIRDQVLRTLQQTHHDDHADGSMATAELDDPTGYGRIIRDPAGEFVEIVEQADATDEQRAIREIFPSYYCLKSDALLFALARLKNENKKGEFYLTDIYGILRREGKKVLAVQAVSAEDVLAVNTREQLAVVDAVLQDRIQRQHREAGVTIVSSVNTYIEADATIGPDTTIQPFTFIGRDSSIGPGCTIGPFAVIPRDAMLPDGARVVGNCSAAF